MAALLLQQEDLPDLPVRREFASAELTLEPTPQLALCRAQETVGPHELASVLAKSGKIGTVEVFQDFASRSSRPDAVGFQYRLTTPDEVGDDVRTVATKGRYTLLVTGYGQPPAGTSVLDYQAAAMTTALDRLPAA